jgi:hypothetical protein
MEIQKAGKETGMIDKSGRLFGKLNIIDLIFIILMLAAAVFAMSRFGVFSPEKAAGTADNKMLLTMYQEEANTFTVSNIKPGDPVSESFQNTDFGKVSGIEIGEPVNWGADQDGRQTAAGRDGYSSIKLEIEAPGTVTSSGLTISGAKYYVGQILVIRVGTSTLYARVEGAEQINQ